MLGNPLEEGDMGLTREKEGWRGRSMVVDNAPDSNQACNEDCCNGAAAAAVTAAFDMGKSPSPS
jgi:hypothetical protein